MGFATASYQALANNDSVTKYEFDYFHFDFDLVSVVISTGRNCATLTKRNLINFCLPTFGFQAAKVLRMEKELGLIATDYFVDIVIVDANPLDDISVLSKPLMVTKDGRVVMDRR